MNKKKNKKINITCKKKNKDKMRPEKPPFTIKLPKFVTDAKIEEIKATNVSVEYEWIDISNILPEFHRIASCIVRQSIQKNKSHDKSIQLTVPIIAHIIAEQFVYFLDREAMLIKNDYSKFEDYTRKMIDPHYSKDSELTYFKVAKQFADAFKPQQIKSPEGKTIVKYPLVFHERSHLREKMVKEFSQFSHLSRGPAFYNPLEKFYSALTTVYFKNMNMSTATTVTKEDKEWPYWLSEEEEYERMCRREPYIKRKLEYSELQAGTSKYDYDTERLKIRIQGQMLDDAWNLLCVDDTFISTLNDNMKRQQESFKNAAKNNTETKSLSFIIDDYAENSTFAEQNRFAIAHMRISSMYFPVGEVIIEEKPVFNNDDTYKIEVNTNGLWMYITAGYESLPWLNKRFFLLYKNSTFFRKI